MASLAAARPQVSVFDASKDAAIRSGDVVLPGVFVAPIRPDIVSFVHSNMSKNSRQPYAVAPRAGMGHSAESWGTGRAVARIPRISGGGTNRSGQGAFGNQCRKGRMFAPTKIWRRWHRHINTNQKRYAVVSALAASALPALVMARGHHIDNVPEIPLVVGDNVQSLDKTKKAIVALKSVGSYDDVQKAKESRKIRAGAGKMRNRRHVHRRGPLVVYGDEKATLPKAVRNLTGVESAHVSRLSLLQLAPGGHLGRFIIWTKSAFEQLDALYGTGSTPATLKSGYRLPRPVITNTDLTAVINSDSIQSALNPAKKTNRSFPHRVRKNPLTNLGALVKLNPYAAQARRAELLSQEARAKRKAAAAAKKGKVALTSHEAAQEKRRKVHSKKGLPKKNYERLIHEAGYDMKKKEQAPYTP